MSNDLDIQKMPDPRKVSTEEFQERMRKALDPLRAAYKAQNAEAKRIVDGMMGDLTKIYEEWPDLDQYTGNEQSSEG